MEPDRFHRRTGFQCCGRSPGGIFYKQFILGQPQELAEALAKLSAMTTLFNAVISTILVAVVYNAVRPVLIKSHLLVIHGHKEQTV